MQFTIDPAIFKRFAGTRIGLVLVTQVNNTVDNKRVIERLAERQSAFNDVINTSLLMQHPFITCWQQAYKSFGANPKEYVSSIENLATRITNGALIRPINTLVDIYNTISLKYMLPIGGQDLDKIEGDIELTFADSDEQPIQLLGQQEKKQPKTGEVIYKDRNGALCRRWNWRQAERVALTPETYNALFFIEALEPVPTALLRDALYELAATIEAECGGSATVAILDEKQPTITVKKNRTYTAFEPYGEVTQSWNVYAMASTDTEQSQETQQRIEKVKEMEQHGIQPWPQAEPVPNTCQEVIDEFGTDQERSSYTIAGRLMSLRWHGKTAFADLQDLLCRIQIYIKKDVIGDVLFEQFKRYIDIGDIVWIHGTVFRTKMGEITLQINDFKLLSKCLHPLPEKFHGLTDTEVRYRKRYLDLISNSEEKEKFIRRSLLIRSIRTFLDKHNYLEVETPMLHPIAGGAAARPFVTHHNALDSDFYLRIAPELYLKRLVIGGLLRVYEINRNFRNEGISTRHNPEFTMLEFYTAYQDYYFAMEFVEDLLRSVLQESCQTLILPFNGHMLDFSQSFRRLSIRNAVLEIGGLQENDITSHAIDATLKKHNITMRNTKATVNEKIYALFEELVEPHLMQPTFITDFPIEVSPLAKRDPNNPAIAARFELFIGGMEVSNGFNELNDPFDQAARFKQQLEAHQAGDEEAHQYDADYIQALEYGLPPTVGVGIGIDRLVMLATDTVSIKDVILFPTLKKTA